MPEKYEEKFESGETVESFRDLIEALKGQPAGFSANMNVWYGEHINLWRKAEDATGRKIALTIMKVFNYDGKPACMVNFKIL